MKKLTLLIVILLSLTIYGQNNKSDGIVLNSITAPPKFAPEEIFRFKPGIVTQLDAGGFGFGSGDRWFSSGRLSTGSQTVYGLRYQVNGKALTLGYNDISNINPRIEWVGQGGALPDNLGDLEFRYASGFTSTNSTLSAAMRADGSTVFSTIKNFSQLNSTKVGILAEGNRNSGLRVYLDGSLSPGPGSLISKVAGYFTAVNLTPVGIGVLAESINSEATSYGVLAQASNAENSNYGVFASVNNSTSSYAIYGAAASTNLKSVCRLF